MHSCLEEKIVPCGPEFIWFCRKKDYTNFGNVYNFTCFVIMNLLHKRS